LIYIVEMVAHTLSVRHCVYYICCLHRSLCQRCLFWNIAENQHNMMITLYCVSILLVDDKVSLAESSALNYCNYKMSVVILEPLHLTARSFALILPILHSLKDSNLQLLCKRLGVPAFSLFSNAESRLSYAHNRVIVIIDISSVKIFLLIQLAILTKFYATTKEHIHL
jgi:hypothetical protein